jgi:hypothetical protein
MTEEKTGLPAIAKAGIGCGGALFVFLIVGGIIYGTIKGANNKFVRQEQEILALDKYILNKMNTAYQDLKTSGAVRNVSMEDFTKIVSLNTNAAIPSASVKPGAFGGMAITKQNMGENSQELDKQILAKIQPYMKDIEKAKTLKIKAVRNYQTTLDSIPDKWFASWLGFPSKRIDLAKENEMIMAGDTSEAKKTGIQDAINPLGDKGLDGKTSLENLTKEKK